MKWEIPINSSLYRAARWMESEEPVPRLPHAQDEPLFLHVPLDGQGQGGGASDVKVRCCRCANVMGCRRNRSCRPGLGDTDVCTRYFDLSVSPLYRCLIFFCSLDVNVRTFFLQ